MTVEAGARAGARRGGFDQSGTQPILSAYYFGSPYTDVATYALFVTVLWVDRATRKSSPSISA